MESFRFGCIALGKKANQPRRTSPELLLGVNL